LLALAWVASLVAASACNSLLGIDEPIVVDAGSTPDSGDAGDSGTGNTGPRCMNDAAIADPGSIDCPVGQECCITQSNVGFCQPSSSGSGDCPGPTTDDICDRGSQCGSGTCYLCMDDGHDVLGSACSIPALGCDVDGGMIVLTLCGQGGRCPSGTCQPVMGGVVGFPSDWFYACQ
jgi:hypothetical protein